MGLLYRVQHSRGQSSYITIDGIYVVRVSDHAEAHPGPNVSVDPYGVKWYEAIKKISIYFKLPLPGYIKAQITRAKNTESARIKRLKEYEKKRAAEQKKQETQINKNIILLLKKISPSDLKAIKEIKEEYKKGLNKSAKKRRAKRIDNISKKYTNGIISRAALFEKI